MDELKHRRNEEHREWEREKEVLKHSAAELESEGGESKSKSAANTGHRNFDSTGTPSGSHDDPSRNAGEPTEKENYSDLHLALEQAHLKMGVLRSRANYLEQFWVEASHYDCSGDLFTKGRVAVSWSP